MNSHSEIILEKMVDHFGEWEKPLTKSKITFKKEKTPKKKEKNQETKQVIDLDDMLVRDRRDELLIFIEELKRLNSREATKIKISSDIYTKNRQEELIYTKKILKAEINTNSFTQAS